MVQPATFRPRDVNSQFRGCADPCTDATTNPGHGPRDNGADAGHAPVCYGCHRLPAPALADLTHPSVQDSPYLLEAPGITTMVPDSVYRVPHRATPQNATVCGAPAAALRGTHPSMQQYAARLWQRARGHIPKCNTMRRACGSAPEVKPQNATQCGALSGRGTDAASLSRALQHPWVECDAPKCNTVPHMQHRTGQSLCGCQERRFRVLWWNLQGRESGLR
jgi:hypothetical protein